MECSAVVVCDRGTWRRVKQSKGRAADGGISAVASENATGAADALHFREIELKLTGGFADLSAIFSDLGGRQSSARVVSTYYDTTDRRLWRKGYTLRLRPKGKGFELTLKRQEGDILDRGEWSALVKEPAADIGALPAEAPRADIGTVLPEELAPRYTTDMVRAKKRVQWPGASVEVSLDNGTIRADDRETELTELEFELESGTLAAMLERLRPVMQRHPFVLGTRSKADRGMELVDGVGPGVATAVKPPLKKADTVETALGKVLAVTTTQIIGCLAAAADGRDPEGVHQLRVGLRRLRSAFTFFTDDLAPPVLALAETAKRAFSALGPARDLDVFVLETLPPVRETYGAGLEPLIEVAGRQRHAAHDAVRQMVGERWFNDFLLELLLASHSSVLLSPGRDRLLLPAVTKILNKRHRKVLKLGKDFADLASPERHRVRIALKKLRYACDYFQSLYPKSAARPYRKRLSSLQDDLGLLNDATIAEHLADRLAADQPGAEVGAALIKGWYGHRLESVQPHMLVAWQRFARARPFWSS